MTALGEEMLLNPSASPAAAPQGRWLEVLSHLDPKYGGLSAAVPELARAAVQAGFDVQLAGFCLPGEEFVPPPIAPLQVSHWPVSRLRWLRDRRMREQFRELVQGADGVHIHGLWTQSTGLAAHMASAAKRPYILSAHGMLEPWALANKSLKKQVYAALFERRNLAGSACLHALTRAEADDYRRFGLRGPIAIIPNGVRVPASVGPDPFLETYPDLAGKQLLLFLGRIHFKKGLELLVRGWARSANQQPDAHLVLAGPDSEGTRSKLENLIGDLGITHRVSFTGMLDAAHKWSALAAAYCFVLPSYSEGLSVSALEAMGMGLPVILSRQCHLPEVAAAGAGWEIEPDLSQLAGALTDCLAQSESSHRAMGQAGRALVSKHFSCEKVGTQFSELYGWVQGGALPVGCELQFAGVTRL